jgi:hypothetical protein
MASAATPLNTTGESWFDTDSTSKIMYGVIILVLIFVLMKLFGSKSDDGTGKLEGSVEDITTRIMKEQNALEESMDD